MEEEEGTRNQTISGKNVKKDPGKEITFLFIRWQLQYSSEILFLTKSKTNDEDKHNICKVEQFH